MVLVRIGLSLPTHLPIDELVDQSKRAKEAGFDYVFMPDHLFSLRGDDMLNKWDVLSVIANRVNIGVGTMVASVMREDPEVLIQHVKTLHKISESKEIMVGLGRGTPYDTVKSNVNVFTLMEYILKNMPKNVVTVVAARGHEMKSLACKYADGWMSRHGLSYDEYMREKKEVAEICPNEFFIYSADVPVAFELDDSIIQSMRYRCAFQDKNAFYSVNSNIVKDVNKLVSTVYTADKIMDKIVVGDESRMVKSLNKYVGKGVGLFSIRVYGDEIDRFGGVIDAVKC